MAGNVKIRKRKENNYKPKLSIKEIKRQKALIIWSILFFIYGVVFYYLPLGGWVMAFKNYKTRKGIFGSDWVGMQKFKFLFSDDTFKKVIRNTFAMGIINLVATTVFAIAFAILLNEIRNKVFKKSIQTISYMPHFLSWVIVCGLLHDALSMNGIVNEVLVKLHIIKSPVSFLSQPGGFWPMVAFANVWKETGWNAIVYLAAITAIDANLYEAASIDGAGRWGKIKNITLPSIRPTIIVLLLINIGNVINAGFEVQYMLRNGLTKSVADTIDIYTLTWSIGQNDYSLGTAAGMFKSLVSIVLVVAANALAKRLGEERLF